MFFGFGCTFYVLSFGVNGMCRFRMINQASDGVHSFNSASLLEQLHVYSFLGMALLD